MARLGESTRPVKVTPAVARDVLERHRKGVAQRDICDQLHLSPSTVWHIIWRWERRLEMQAELRMLKAQARTIEARCMALERRLKETEHETE